MRLSPFRSRLFTTILSLLIISIHFDSVWAAFDLINAARDFDAVGNALKDGAQGLKGASAGEKAGSIAGGASHLPPTKNPFSTADDLLNVRNAKFGVKDIVPGHPVTSSAEEAVTHTVPNKLTRSQSLPSMQQFAKNLKSSKSFPAGKFLESITPGGKAGENIEHGVQTGESAGHAVEGFGSTRAAVNPLLVNDEVARAAAQIRGTGTAQLDLIGNWGHLQYMFKAPFRWISTQIKNYRAKGMIRWLALEDHPLSYVKQFASRDPFAEYAIRSAEKRTWLGHLLFERLHMVDRTREAFPMGGPGVKAFKALGRAIAKPFKKAPVTPVTQESTEAADLTRGAASTGHEGASSSHGPPADHTPGNTPAHELNPEKPTKPTTTETSPPEVPKEPETPRTTPAIEEPVIPPPVTPVVNGRLPFYASAWNKFKAPFSWISKHLGAWQTRRYNRTAVFYLRYLARHGPPGLRARILNDKNLVAFIAEYEAQLSKAGYLRQSAFVLSNEADPEISALREVHPTTRRVKRNF